MYIYVHVSNIAWLLGVWYNDPVNLFQKYLYMDIRRWEQAASDALIFIIKNLFLYLYKYLTIPGIYYEKSNNNAILRIREMCTATNSVYSCHGLLRECY